MKTNCTLLFLLLLADHCIAIHILGSSIQARRISSSASTYEFTVLLFYDAAGGRSAADQQTEVLFCFGDNSTPQQIPRIDYRPGEQDASIYIGVYRTTYTYPGGGTRTVSARLSNRSDNIRTLPGAINQPYYLEATLSLDVLNTTPAFPTPVRRFTASVNQPVSFNLGTTDAEGDSIRYVVTRARMGGCDRSSQPLTGYLFPNEVTQRGTFGIDARTGRLTWNGPTETGLYEFVVAAEEWRSGQRISLTQFSMIIRVEDRGGPPAVIPPYEPVRVDGELVTGSRVWIAASLSARPIPSPDRFHITFKTDEAAPAIFQLFDMQGRMMQEISVPTASHEHELTIDAQQWAPGTYLIRAYSGNRALSTKLLKK